jgi:hypothetical protein
MIAMVTEEQLQRLANECLCISERTEDARAASGYVEALPPHSSARNPDNAYLARTRPTDALASRAHSRDHQHRSRCRGNREIVDR